MKEWELIKWLISFVAKVKGKVILAVLLGIVSNLSVVAIPLIGVKEVLFFLDGQSTHPYQALGLMVICGVIRGLARYGEQYLNHDIAFSLLAKIREQIFEVIRRLGAAKVTGKKSGDLITAITSDVEALEVFFAHTISPILIAFGTTIVTISFLWWINPMLASILLVGQLLVGVIIPVIGYKKSKLLGDEYQAKFVELNQAVMEDVSSLQDIAGYSLETMQLAKLNGAGNKLNKQYKKRLTQESILRIISEIVLLGTAVCIFIIGVQVELPTNVVLPSVILSLSSFGSVLALSGLGSALLTTFASARRLALLTKEKPSVDFSKSYHQLTTLENVLVDKMSFSYGQKRREILSDVSLTIKQGSVIGIGGESGSGKSTLIKLLMRYWDPEQGKIKIGASKLSVIQENTLHQLEGVMEQSTFIFEDTIAANIGFNRRDLSMDELIDATRKASIHEWILSLPEQYETKIGGNQRSVSDGERQRIGLARLFLHDAPLLLLDEPTSNLDYLNEQEILRSLKEGLVNKTVVLISHRETTLEIAEKQYVLTNGKLIVN